MTRLAIAAVCVCVMVGVACGPGCAKPDGAASPPTGGSATDGAQRTRIAATATLPSHPALGAPSTRGAPPAPALIEQALAVNAALVPYAAIDRLDDGTVRVISISDDARAAIQRGEPLPLDAVIVMESYTAKRDANGALLRDDAGRLIPAALDGVFVRARLDDAAWPDSALVPEGIRNGDWDYATIDPTTGEVGSVNNLACHACHQQAEAWDYAFTRPKLNRWAETGEVQHGACDRVGRQPCDKP